MTRTTAKAAVLFVFLLMVANAATTAYGQVPTVRPFSADMVTSHRGESMQGKMYFGGNKMRMDMAARGHESIMIMDVAKKTTYMLMPQQRMYMEFNAAMAERSGMRRPDIKPVDPGNPCSVDAAMKCRKVGTEVVNGRPCDKWEFTSQSGYAQTVWIDQKLHFMIKTLGSDGTTTELRNIQEGPQAASLFEIPAGYQKFDMGSMMGQRPPKEQD